MKEGSSMATAVPIRDTKDTAKFSQLVNEADGPVVVTKNGYDEYVALSVEEYGSLCHKAAMSDLYAHLLASERQAAEGKVVPYVDFRDELRKRYGI